MQKIRIAVLQARWPGSREAILQVYRPMIAEAAAKGAQLACLQEFTISPYFASQPGPSGFDWAEEREGGPTHQFLGELARQHGMYIIGSIFEREGKNFWDTATLYNPQGQLHGFTRKIHIPQGEGYHENLFFAGSDEYPIHDVLGLKLAMPTCYDQWFPELSRIYALQGAEFIFYPTAIGSEPESPGVDTREAWQTVMRAQAIANGIFIAAANRVGVEGVTFYGSSFVCEPGGNIIAQASRSREEILLVDLDPAALQEWRRLFPLLRQRRPSAYTKILEAPAAMDTP